MESKDAEARSHEPSAPASLVEAAGGESMG